LLSVENSSKLGAIVLKLKWFISLLIISFVLFFLFQLGCPALFTVNGDGKLWVNFRYFILAVLFSIIVNIFIYICKNKDELCPYYLKFKKYIPLLTQLVRRDFLAKYKRSILGVLWSLLNPLMTMLILTIVFSFVFRFDIANFPVYLLSGQIIFTLFSESTNLAMSSILSNASLIKKVSIPKYIFPLSRCLSSLVNFVFSFIALILVMVVTRAQFHISMLYCPIVILYAFAFSTGIGLILSAAVVFFRDINYLYGILLTAVTYFTPLFYPIEIIPDRFRWIISLNPLYHMVECFRTCTIYGGIPTLWQNLVCALLALVSMGVGLAVFYRKQDDFILYV